MNTPDDNRFCWSQSYGRDRFYTQYKPKVKIYSFFFLILPWFNLMLLAFAYVYFFHALSVVPGEKVNLPIASEYHSGITSGFIITARPLYASDKSAGNEQYEKIKEDNSGTADYETLPAIVVFFNDERFNLSKSHRYADFEAKLRKSINELNEKSALIYADKNIVLDDAMKLLNVLRNAGLKDVCFVEEAK